MEEAIIEEAGDVLVGEALEDTDGVSITTTMAMVQDLHPSMYRQSLYQFFLQPLFTYSLFRFFIKSLRFLSEPSILIV
jgi:hypothetical protein